VMWSDARQQRRSHRLLGVPTQGACSQHVVCAPDKLINTFGPGHLTVTR
jgi:hypothetical protein